MDFNQETLNYILYGIAYLTTFVAFSMKSIYWLRLFTIISSFFYSAYYYVAPQEPMWINILTESLLIAVNLIMLIIIWYQNSQIRFSDYEKELYETLFRDLLTPFEYLKLIRIAKFHHYKKGYFLTRKNETINNLFFIYNGRVSIYDDDKVIRQSSDGDFIGEISFKLKQETASATAQLDSDSVILQWPQKELNEFLERNPNMKNIFLSLLVTDLAKKLVQS